MIHPGKRIADLRKRMGYTQHELSSRIDCSRAYLARVETELQEPSLKFIDSVATALGIPAGIIMLNREDLPDQYKDLYEMLDALIETKAALA